jgi:hypothetical protein
MATFTAKVLMEGNGTYSAQPKDMSTDAANVHQARQYFESFGKVIQGPWQK